MNVDLVVALIAGLFGLVGAIIASISATRQASTARDVARIDQAQKDAADEARHERLGEKDARREYNYQAQKRLYELYEPLRFQMVHASARALRRISELSLPSTSEPHTEQAMRGPAWQLHQAAYDLLAPLALVRLVERKITLVDLRLDPQAALEVGLAKGLTDAIGDERLLARMSPSLESVHPAAGPVPPRSARQGLDPAELELVLSLLITTTTTGAERLCTGGEFMLRMSRSPALEGAAELTDLLEGFTPTGRPVLWRVLVTHTLLYGCLLTVALIGAPSADRIGGLGREHAELLKRALERGQRLDLDWKVELESSSDVDCGAFLLSLPVAVEYYERRVAPASQVIWKGLTGLSPLGGV